MSDSYRDSVLAAADEHGNLSYADATKLLTDHGTSWAELYDSSLGCVMWPKLQACKAEALLTVLGY